VITGGEPMIAKGIHELAEKLMKAGKHVTIETAATAPPKGIVCSLASLSPKLSNSTPGKNVSAAIRAKHESMRFQPELVREWIAKYNFQLKFVVGASTDLAEIKMYLSAFNSIPPEKILLMPEGTTTRAISRVNELVVEACKENGYRYCDRLHIRLFGNKRGR
jgi:7-carboxy-7-deazaguanine synthase